MVCDNFLAVKGTSHANERNHGARVWQVARRLPTNTYERTIRSSNHVSIGMHRAGVLPTEVAVHEHVLKRPAQAEAVREAERFAKFVDGNADRIAALLDRT